MMDWLTMNASDLCDPIPTAGSSHTPSSYIFHSFFASSALLCFFFGFTNSALHMLQCSACLIEVMGRKLFL